MQEPGRMNHYTAMISIDVRQGGGDSYAIEVTWHAEADVSTVPARSLMRSGRARMRYDSAS